MIRLFAAFTAPESITADLSRRQKGILGARWRPLESLHVTLRFFGPLSENKADDLDSELSAISARSFYLSLEGVGVFGEGADVHAVWAGMAPNEPLMQLARRCERAARRAGLARERRAYRPHVTLAYLRNASSDEVGAWVQQNNLLKSPSFLISRFGLYSSWPGEDGAVYRLERAYSLS
ncbi:MAG TPA: RNA 2',3'-cyclic phosphodiesterase [Caulobacteraceae bacterium]|jgi:2'-5' RNA ligase